MTVRRATKADYLAMVKIVEEFFESNSYAHIEVDIDIKTIGRLIELLTKEHLMIVLETDDKRIVGGAGGLVVPFLFNTNIKIFQEIFTYVEPGFRKYSQLLLVELKKICIEMGLNRMIMGYPCDGKSDKMARYYKARGFKELETHFIARI